MICCLCKKEIKNGYGNNPYPLEVRDGMKCCDTCNIQKVIPARMMLAMNSNRDTEGHELSDR